MYFISQIIFYMVCAVLSQDVLENVTYTIFPGNRNGIVDEFRVDNCTFAHIMIKFFISKNGTTFFDGCDTLALIHQYVRR